MRVEVIPARELSAEQAEHWSALQRSDPRLANPFFRPELARVVGEVREDAFVGIMHENGRPFGYFPFQRAGRLVGRPIGGPLSDYQGVVAEPDAEWSGAALVHGCGLALWDFDHLLAEQAQFQPYHHRRTTSPIVDVSNGYAAYAEERTAAGSSVIRQTNRLIRRIERELGPLRFVAHTRDDAVFRATVEWKRRQYRETGVLDVFGFPWTVELIDRVRAVETPDFAGLVSALYAGDTLVATHIGLRSRTVWHYWFPTYAREHGRHSPGMILLLEMAEAAEALGLTSIDLGKGGGQHKDRLMNAEVALAEGWVAAPSIGARWVQARRAARTAIRRALPPALARYPKRLLRAARFR